VTDVEAALRRGRELTLEQATELARDVLAAAV
jgi:hypothetical protein